MSLTLSNSARLRVTLLALATFLFPVVRDASADANSIAIDSVTIRANRLILQGRFGSGTAQVVFASKSLPILESSPGQVVAELNPVPHIGTYTVILTVGNKSATTFAAVSAKTLGGIIASDGSVAAGNGFAATRLYRTLPGHFPGWHVSDWLPIRLSPGAGYRVI